MALKKLADLPPHWLQESRDRIAGWPLVGRHGQALGTVQDLIVDVDRCQVVYAEAAVGDRPVLIPVGRLRVDADARRLSSDLEASQLRSLPSREVGTDLDPDAADGVRITFLPDEGPTGELDPYFARIADVLATECSLAPQADLTSTGTPLDPTSGIMPPSPDVEVSNAERFTYSSGTTSESPILTDEGEPRHRQPGISPASAESEDADLDHGPGD